VGFWKAEKRLGNKNLVLVWGANKKANSWVTTWVGQPNKQFPGKKKSQQAEKSGLEQYQGENAHPPKNSDWENKLEMAPTTDYGCSNKAVRGEKTKTLAHFGGGRVPCISGEKKSSGSHSCKRDF